MLTRTKTSVTKIDYYDLDECITSFLKEKGYSEKNFNKYGYQCIAENEWCNYQSHSFTVKPKMPTSADLEDLGGLSTGELLDYMCAEGNVEAGEYLVEIFW